MAAPKDHYSTSFVPTIAWFVILHVALEINKGEDGEFLGGCILITVVTICYVLRPWFRNSLSFWSSSPVLEKDYSAALTNNEAMAKVISPKEDEEVATRTNKRSTSAKGTMRLQQSSSRIEYLSNIKLTLTILVVTFHVNCAFGGCVKSIWFLILDMKHIGTTAPYWFINYIDSSMLLVQCFIMPVFFFCSAYFVPKSYNNNKQIISEGSTTTNRFISTKGRRLWIPAMLVTVVVAPATFALAQSVAQRDHIVFWPIPLHGWFLWWLLLFHWVYHTYCVYSANHDNPNQTKSNTKSRTTQVVCGPVQPPKFILFSTWRRWLWGAMLGFVQCTLMNGQRKHTILTMPNTVGTLPLNMFMYWMGIQAQQYGWLDCTRTIREQMDVSTTTLRLWTVIEMVLLVCWRRTLHYSRPLMALLFFILSGMYCLDIALIMLDFYQQNCNYTNPCIKKFSNASFGVYLFHPTIITGLTAIFIWFTNYKLQLRGMNEVIFVPGPMGGYENDLGLPPIGHLGGEYYPLGYAFIVIGSHLVTWPVCHILKQLPMLKGIL